MNYVNSKNALVVDSVRNVFDAWRGGVMLKIAAQAARYQADASGGASASVATFGNKA